MLSLDVLEVEILDFLGIKKFLSQLFDSLLRFLNNFLVFKTISINAFFLTFKSLKSKETVEPRKNIANILLGFPEVEIFFVPNCMNNVDYFSKYFLVEKNHQLHQKIAQLTLFLQLLNEICLLTVSQLSVSLYCLINGFWLGWVVHGLRVDRWVIETGLRNDDVFNGMVVEFE